jgi:hypothetical protein
MAGCPTLLIDSNLTVLSIAEEACPGVLPSPESDTKWYYQDPNGYNSFSTNVETVQRNTINASRQNKKGTVTSEDVAGGFMTDLTNGNLTRFLQGFFFANARQPASVKTQLNGTTYAINTANMASANGGLDDVFNVTSGALTAMGLVVGALINKYGWADPLDNGLARINATTLTATTVTSEVARTNRTIASPPAGAGFEIVGVQFASADVNISFVSNILSLTSTVYNFTTNTNLFPGQWIYLGGDGAAFQFTNNRGYARIRSVSATALVLENPTWAPVTEVGTGKTIRLFFGITVKDESDPALIRKRTYQLERQLGKSTDGTPQAEYLVGCVANDLTINIPAKEKVTADLGFVGMRGEERTGLSGNLIKAGTRLPLINEGILNTSSNVFLMRMGLVDPASSMLSTSMFAYVTEGSFTLSNGATAQPAVGILGALDITVGNIAIGGSVTAYFTQVAVKTTIRKNTTVSLSFIFAKDNTGNILDIPELTISGGDITVEKDNPITVPLTGAGHENKFGYTGSYTQFRYLPNIAMPV